MKLFAGKDINFTEGSIVKKVALFSVPLILSEVLQSLYGSVDSMVVGKYVGNEALSAVSVSAPIAQLLISFFNGLSLGNTVVVAKAFGSGDRTATARAIRCAFTFSLICGIATAVCGILLAGPMLRLAGCTEEVYPDAIIYLRIYLAGVLFTVIYNCGTGILRAIGDAQNPLLYLLAASLLNIGLDYLFVAGFGWSIYGAGIATVIAQLLSVILVYREIRGRIRTGCLAFRETWTQGRRIIAESLGVGIAAGIQNATIALSNVFVWRYINLFPTDISAGVGVAHKLERFVNMPTRTFAMTTTTYISQNLGKKDYQRARKGLWSIYRLCVITTLGIEGLLYLVLRPVTGLFSEDPAVIAAALNVMRVYAPFYVVMTVRETLSGILRGYGYNRITTLINLFGMVILRQIFLAVAMPVYHSINVVNYGFPICWFSTALLLSVYFLVIGGRKIMEPPAEEG